MFGSRWNGADLDSPIRRARSGPVRRLIRRVVVGENTAARRNVRNMLELLSPNGRPRILVVGGAVKGSGLDPLYAHAEVELLSFDIYTSALVDLVADAHSIPLKDCCVDGVIVQAVLEHVADPWEVVAEIERVLRPGGIVYADSPFLQPVHEGPYDFFRFSESAHRYLFRNFSWLSSGVVAGSGAQTLWSIEYLVRGLFRSVWAGKIAKCAFCWLRLLDLCIPNQYAIDAACGVYFLGRKEGKVLTNAELVEYYSGSQQLRRMDVA